MQSLLVDINTAAITYRRECLQALEKKKYATCLGCIKAMNGLLPKDEDNKSYRLRINTDEYNEKVKGTVKARCKYCQKDTDRKLLDVYETRLNNTTATIIGYNIEKLWLCPSCKKENILTKTDIIQSDIPQPFYCQVVPDPPRKKIGLLNQIEYDKQVTEWVWLCLDNLEESFTRYRKDYEPKGQTGLYEDSGIDTSLHDDD